MLGIECHNTPSCCTGSRLNTHTIFQICCQQTIWILIPQVILAQKRQLVQIFNAMNIFRLYMSGIHLFPIIRHIFIDMLDLCHQALGLKRLHVLQFHGFNFRLIITLFHILLHFSFISICAASSQMRSQRGRIREPAFPTDERQVLKEIDA